MRTISLKISAHMRLKRLQKIISDPAWKPTKKTREFWTAIRDYHLDLTDDQLRQKKPVPSY